MGDLEDSSNLTVASDVAGHTKSALSQPEAFADMEIHEPSDPDGTLTLSLGHLEQFRRFGATASRYIHEQAIFATLRERALLLRDQVAYERKGYWQNRDYVRESLQNAVSRLTQFSDTTLARNFAGELWELKERVLKDQMSLDEETEKLRKLEEQLSTVEFKLQLHEKRLADHAADAMSQLRALHILEESQTAPGSTVSGQNTPSVKPTGASTPPLNPVLEHFYDKAGWLRIVHYRLVDLNQFHAEERARRLLADDQGRPLDTSWNVFEADYRREQEKLQQDLNEAIAEEGDARAACFAAGLDPDMHKKSMPEADAAGETLDIPIDLIEAVAPELDFVPWMPDDKQFPMLSAIGDDAYTSILAGQVPAEETYQRIDDWLQDDDFMPAMNTWIDPELDTRPNGSRLSSGGPSVDQDGSWVLRRAKAGTSRRKAVLAQKSGHEQIRLDTREAERTADPNSTLRPTSIVRRLSDSDFLSLQSRRSQNAAALINPISRHAAIRLFRPEPLALSVDS